MGMSEYMRGLRQKVGRGLVLVPSAAAFVRDREGRVLLVRSTAGNWMLPGGAVDPGESPAEAACREAWEEAGVGVEPLRIAGVFGGREYRNTYPNGDRIAFVVTVFEARLVSGEPRPDGDETAEVGWFEPDALATLPLAEATRSTLRDLLAGVEFRRPQPSSGATR